MMEAVAEPATQKRPSSALSDSQDDPSQSNSKHQKPSPPLASEPEEATAESETPKRPNFPLSDSQGDSSQSNSKHQKTPPPLASEPKEDTAEPETPRRPSSVFRDSQDDSSQPDSDHQKTSPPLTSEREKCWSSDTDSSEDNDCQESDVEDWTKPLPRDKGLEESIFCKSKPFMVSMAKLDLDDSTPMEVIGNDIPPPVTAYTDLNFTKIIRKNLRLASYTQPTFIQRHVMPVVLTERDLMVYVRHGKGTISSFVIPILHQILINGPVKLEPSHESQPRRYPLAVFVATSHVHVTRIYEECQRFTYRSQVRCFMIHSDDDTMIQFRGYSPSYHILITEATCFDTLIDYDAIGFDYCRHLAVQGIDKMLQCGLKAHIYRVLQNYTQCHSSQCQTLLLSTTLPREIQWLAEEFLDDYVFLKVGYVNLPRNDVIQKIVPVEEEHKRSFLISILMAANIRDTSHGKDALTLVFVEKKKDVNALDVLLNQNGYPVTSIHGERSSIEREEAIRLFRSGQCPVMIGTLMAIRAVDLPSVTHVILYDMPQDIEKYSLCLSYTGHPDKVGLATSFFSNKKNLTSLVPELVDMLKASQQEVPTCLQRLVTSQEQHLPVVTKGESEIEQCPMIKPQGNGEQLTTTTTVIN